MLPVSVYLALLYSPGFFMFLACLFTVILFKMPKQGIKKTLRSTWKQWTSVVLSMTGLIAMAFM